MAAGQKAQLEAWVRAPTTPQKIVLCSRICLLAHAGLGNRQIARQLITSRPTVLLWRERFAQAGVPGLEHELPRKASAQRLDEALLRDLASTTGGAFFREEDLHKLPDTISAKTERVRSPLEVELWSSPLFFLLLLGVVTAEWVLRKLSYLK